MSKVRFWLLLVLVGLGAIVVLRHQNPQTNASVSENGIHLPSKHYQVSSGPLVYTNYAGSASCVECHDEAYHKWAASHHAEAERLVLTNRDLAAFEPAREFKHGTQKTFVQWSDDHALIAGFGPGHHWQTNVVARVIGEDPLRQFLLQFPGGRYQVQEASYDPRTNQWFNVYGNEDRQPGEWGHWTGRGMNWNSMCAACHNTRVQKNYDAANDTYHTAMAEPTVSCEACHGPLKAHVDWEKKYRGSRRTDPTFPKLSREQTQDMCASCHARRTDLTGNFVPGDRFEDHYELSTVDSSELFYPDGQIHDEDYEASAFFGSKMHQTGITCLDCHPRSLHMAKLHGNDLCMQCHKGGFPKAPGINPTEHSHHAATSTGNECASCHMPQTVYMQRHWRHDHGFTIPDPLLTKEFGVPNACNRCHTSQDADWALAKVQSWYGEKMQRHTRERAQIIARARNGDETSTANLVHLLQSEEIPYWRAVAANLLGNWAAEKDVIPALLQALSDTNAMVRSACVRSLASMVDNEQIATALATKLSDPLRNVRVAAAWALRATLDTNSPAAADLNRYLELSADQPAGQLQLGAYELARGNMTNALLHYEKAAEWDPYSAGVHHELAIVLSHLGRIPEAITQLQEAVKLAPKEAEFHFKLALAFNEAGENARTLAELEQAVKCNPRHSRAWYNLGLARNASGDPSGGIEALLRAESCAPNDAEIPYARATILARVGKVKQARQAAQRALELKPDFSQAAALLNDLQ